MRVFILGKGKVGATLAGWFGERGAEVELAGRGREPSQRVPPSGPSGLVPPRGGHDTSDQQGTWDLVVLAVPDAAVGEACRGLTERGVDESVPAVHCSGRTRASGYCACGRPHGSMHPAFAFPVPGVAGADRACFLLDGDEAAAGAAARLLDECRLAHVSAPAGVDRQVYHAACLLAANFTGLLGLTADALMRRAGLPPDAAGKLIFSLLDSMVENSRTMGFGAALTGPALRGDTAAIVAEAEAIGRRYPEALPLFLEGNRSLAVHAGRLEVVNAILEWARSRAS